MRRRFLVGLCTAGALALASTGAAVAALASDGGPAAAVAGRRTAEVDRTTLTSGLSLNGQLGYGAAHAIAGTGLPVTHLPAAGDVVGLGEVLYQAGGRPVFALRGDAPLWRDLALGDTGDDVLALRAALAGLGYDVGDPGNRTYDEHLAEVVGALYRDRGLTEPKDGPTAQQRQREARADLDAAQATLAADRAARAAKTAPATAGDRAEARSAVSAAERALAAAEQSEREAAAAREAAEAAAAGEAAGDEPADTAAPPGTTSPSAGDAPMSVPDARDALDVARARLADLGRRGDTSAESAAVAASTSAVEAAARALAAARANQVGPADIVLVAADAVRVQDVAATIGESTESTVLTWTATTLQAFAGLTEAQARELSAGTAATIRLPDGTELTGTIAEVTEASTSADGAPVSPEARIALDEPAAAADHGLASVKVTVPAQEAADALVVPVTALLALAEGGYAVELVDPKSSGGTRLVPVEVGLVADTRAQVVTDELAPGDEVVVP